MLVYLKINIALAVFYIFYQLLFRKDTFFVWRRVLLLAIPLTAAVLPFVDLQTFIRPESPVAELGGYYQLLLPEAQAQAPNPESGTTWSTFAGKALQGLLAAGWITLSIRFVGQLIRISLLARNCRKTKLKGIDVFLLPVYAGPFSFFNRIFIYPAAHSEQETEEILWHEKTHITQYHSFDMLLAELTVIFCWINPFAWLWKRELQDNLEYLADHNVLHHGFDSKSYQYHLVGLSTQKAAAHLYTNFNVLSLKNRIRMMNRKPTQAIKRWKYLAFLPLTALLAFCNQPKEQVETAEPVSETVAPASDNTEATAETSQVSDSTVFTVVEIMPEFPGGMHALMDYIAKNIKYPAEAQQQGQQGRVICAMTITSDGSIRDVEVLRGVTPVLDQEAVRVIQSMPKWTPGKQRGKAVAVRYTIPVMFKLQ